MTKHKENIMQAIIIGILKSLLTEKLIKVLAAEAIEMVVKATDNTVDDRMAAPILAELRK